MSINKSKSVVITTIFFSIVVMISCTTKKTDDATPNVSFSKDILPIFQANCAVNGACHYGSLTISNNIDLTDSMAYNTIISQGLVYPSTPTASMLYNEIASGRMPKDPYPKLSEAKIKLVLNWIQQGVKDN